MWVRCLLLTAVTIGAAGVSIAVPAGADPAEPPPPPLPDVTHFTPISPVDYAVLGATAYAFQGLPGVSCLINRQSISYGCSGTLPGAPGGANLVSGGLIGPPGFSSTDQPIFSGALKPLPPDTRLSFREISCGVDGAGVLACVNTREQVGFVISAAGSFINDVNPLLARPDGVNQYLPGLPPG